MISPNRLNNILRLHEMRSRLSQQRLNRSIQKSRKRATLAQEGHDLHLQAQTDADNFVRNGLSNVDLASSAGQFFTSLAVGHQMARQEAVALGARADRLKERRNEAELERSDLAQEHVKIEQRKRQFLNVANDLVAHSRSDADEQDEEEVQDLLSGRIQNGAL